MQSVFEGNRLRWIFEDGTAVLIERASPRELKTLAKGGVSRDSCARNLLCSGAYEILTELEQFWKLRTANNI